MLCCPNSSKILHALLIYQCKPRKGFWPNAIQMHDSPACIQDPNALANDTNGIRTHHRHCISSMHTSSHKHVLHMPGSSLCVWMEPCQTFTELVLIIVNISRMGVKPLSCHNPAEVRPILRLVECLHPGSLWKQ